MSNSTSSSKVLVNVLKILLFFGVGLTILFLVYRNQNAAWLEDCALKGLSPNECGTLAEKVVRDFQSANFFWIFLVLIAFMVSNVSRAARWMMLLKPLGYVPRKLNAFLAIMLGYFANLGFPRIGEFVRAGSLSRYEKIPAEKIMGTIVVDRITDVLSLLVVVALAFALEYETLWAFLQEGMKNSEDETGPGLLYYLLIGGSIFTAIAGLLLFIFRKKVMQSAIYKKLVNILKGFWEGIQTIRQLEHPVRYILHSINIWLMYYIMTYIGFFAFAPTEHLSALAGLVVFVAGTFGMLIPSPGGMGSYHALLGGALENLYGINGADAFSMANILFFSIQIGCNVLFGLLALLILPIYNRNYQPAHE